MIRCSKVSKCLQSVDRVTCVVAGIVSRIAAYILALMMMVIVVDVVLRFLDRPVIGAVEVVKFMLLMVVFLAMPNTQYRKSHIAIDLIYNRLAQKGRRVMNIFNSIVSLGIVSILAWRAFVHLKYFINEGSYVVALKIPNAPFQFILTFGWVLLGFILLLECIHMLIGSDSQ